MTRYKIKSSDAIIHYQDPALAVPLPAVDKEDVQPVKRGRKPKQQLFSSLEQFFEPNEQTKNDVAVVGKSTRSKSKRM